jgi:hypothetical protein
LPSTRAPGELGTETKLNSKTSMSVQTVCPSAARVRLPKKPIDTVLVTPATT